VAKAKETVSRTLIVALVLSIFFSVVVSTAAVSLRPAQIKNQNLDIKTNILAAAGMLEPGASADQIEEEFARFDVRLLDLDSGDYVEPSDVGVQDPMKYDMYKAASDPEMSTNIPSSADKAGIKRRPNVAKIYTLTEMAKGDVIFAATGVTDGSLLDGVKHLRRPKGPTVMTTDSVVMRASSGTVRWIKAEHRLD